MTGDYNNAPPPDRTEGGARDDAGAKSTESIASGATSVKRKGVKYDPTQPPPIMPLRVENIPEELRALNRWVCWEWEWKPNAKPPKWSKPPKRADGRGNASSTDKGTWTTFDKALNAAPKFAGIGVVLTEADELTGVDLDNCVQDGRLKPWAQRIVDRLDSYTEISPSGTGVRVFLFGRKPGDRCRTGDIETYKWGRYLTVTGQHLPGTPKSINRRQDELAAFYTETFNPAKPEQAGELGILSTGDAAPDVSDDDLIAKASAADDGGKFADLWAGRWQGRYPSESEATAALCTKLAYWTGKDAARMDRLFRHSGMMRPKWDERRGQSTWGAEEIQTAIEFCADAPAPAKRRKKYARREGDNRHEIKVRSDDLTVRLAEGWTALERYNDLTPRVFRFGGIVADIQQNVMGAPIIRHVRPDAMREIMANAAWWYRLKKDGEAIVKVPVSPPGELVGPMLATPSTRLPVLTRIARAPMLTPSGKIHACDGYDPETRCWFALNGLSLPTISSNPTQAEIEAARDFLLVELMGDFPFVEDGDRANALAMLLVPFVREIIDGPTPLHLIEKPLAGSGATLLASCAGIVGRGDEPPLMTEGSDEDEWRKRLTSTLITGPEMVVIDNLRRPLDSAALSSVLTKRVHSDRLLGKSENVELLVQCVWIATGNNPTTSSEIARRVVPIRLDPKTDSPTERTGFRHPKLTAWTRENRSALLHAALTLAQAWHAAGRPEGNANLASYERYSGVMGGILDVAGVPGFLSNRSSFKARADVETEVTRAFIAKWAEVHRNVVVGAGDLFQFAGDLDLGNGNDRSQRIKFGKWLRGLVERVFTFDGVALCVEAVGKINKSAAYRLTSSEPEC